MNGRLLVPLIVLTLVLPSVAQRQPTDTAAAERAESAGVAAAVAGRRVPILMYHKIAAGHEPCDFLWVSRDLFARQMAALRAAGYESVSLRDFVAAREGSCTLPERPVIITFDDGYENFTTAAAPVLEEYGFRASVFLPADFIGTRRRADNSWDPGGRRCPAPMLIWPEVVELDAAGHEIGSHSRTHPRFGEIGAARVRDELVASRAALRARLGRRDAFLSYPFGDGADDPAIRGLVRRAGYRAALSMRSGIADTRASDPFALPRIMVTEAHDPAFDPDHPERFFMRLVDPRFPLPVVERDASVR